METENKSISELFAAYDSADEVVVQAKAAKEAAERVRSDACKAIALAIAPKKKVLRAGRELTVVVRDNKSEGFTTYFFRGAKSGDDAVVVD
jgi:hypothetical protein